MLLTTFFEFVILVIGNYLLFGIWDLFFKTYLIRNVIFNPTIDAKTFYEAPLLCPLMFAKAH